MVVLARHTSRAQGGGCRGGVLLLKGLAPIETHALLVLQPANKEIAMAHTLELQRVLIGIIQHYHRYLFWYATTINTICVFD